MTPLRLVADDLTGALDAAAPFSSADRPIPVFMADRLPAVLPVSYAVDLGTRELERGAAQALAARQARLVRPGLGVLAFRKLDSLLRGCGGHELAATLRAGGIGRCLIAPAFPFHGRITRGGRQWLRGRDGHPTGEALRASLESLGVRVSLARAGDAAPPGVSLWDAASDGDLRSIAAAGNRLGEPILWCGSGGLAGALGPGHRPPPPELERPILGLFGSDDPATVAQLEASADHVLAVGSGGDGSDAGLALRLDQAGLCLATFRVAEGTSRAEAAAIVARGIERLVGRISRPRGLVVAGGQTLRSVLRSVGAGFLEVFGQLVPGVPISRIRGGVWEGTVVVSKSGAFGGPGLIRRIIGIDRAP